MRVYQVEALATAVITNSSAVNQKIKVTLPWLTILSDVYPEPIDYRLGKARTKLPSKPKPLLKPNGGGRDQQIKQLVRDFNKFRAKHRKPRVNLTDAARRMVLAGLADGETQQSLADRFGVGQSAISKIKCAAGLPMQKRTERVR